MAYKASAFDGGCNPAQQAQSLWELLYLLKDHTPSALRGEARLRGPESCTLLQERERRHLRCARLRRAPRQRCSSPAGASTRSARASARTRSRFGHQDAQTPPSPFVGEGKTPPPVRAPPARIRTPKLPLARVRERGRGVREKGHLDATLPLLPVWVERGAGG